MSKYWVISPFDSDKTDLYEAAWAFCLSDGLISVGRTFPIDISVSSQDELRSLVSKHYAHKTKNVQSWKLNMFWNFYNEISTGDMANAVLRPKVEAVCRESGYDPPAICTPQELMRYE